MQGFAELRLVVLFLWLTTLVSLMQRRLFIRSLANLTTAALAISLPLCMGPALCLQSAFQGWLIKSDESLYSNCRICLRVMIPIKKVVFKDFIHFRAEAMDTVFQAMFFFFLTRQKFSLTMVTSRYVKNGQQEWTTKVLNCKKWVLQSRKMF